MQSAADTGFNRYTICNLHALLSENLCPLSYVDVPEKAYIDGLPAKSGKVSGGALVGGAKCGRAGGSVSPGALFFLLTWRRLDKDMVDRN